MTTMTSPRSRSMASLRVRATGGAPSMAAACYPPPAGWARLLGTRAEDVDVLLHDQQIVQEGLVAPARGARLELRQEGHEGIPSTRRVRLRERRRVAQRHEE